MRQISQTLMLQEPAQCSFLALSTVTDSIYTKVIPREGMDREHMDKGRWKASASPRHGLFPHLHTLRAFYEPVASLNH